MARQKGLARGKNQDRPDALHNQAEKAGRNSLSSPGVQNCRECSLVMPFAHTLSGWKCLTWVVVVSIFAVGWLTMVFSIWWCALFPAMFSLPPRPVLPALKAASFLTLILVVMTSTFYVWNAVRVGQMGFAFHKKNGEWVINLGFFASRVYNRLPRG
ncbi:MAG: hypothetical protein ACUVRF_11510 [Desulfotomaculales bacterium]